MKWPEDCLRCLFDARIYDAYQGNATDKEIQLIIGGTASSLQFPKSKAFRYSWRILKDVIGDVYQRTKWELFKKALETPIEYPKSLEDALRIATLGNMYDTAVGGQYRMQNAKYGKLIALGTDLLLNGGKMVYAIDNLPELPYDVAAAKFFQRLGWEVTLVAREESYEIDATYSDLAEVAQLLNWDGGLEALPSDCTIYDRCDEAKELRSNVDLIVSKGLLNADAYIDFQPSEPSILLYMAKCRPLAEAVGAEIGDGVAVLGEILLKGVKGGI
ncbi:ARMT1-like domain-containing protein [Ignicoccus islandicus]|nr:ARMT1-like domain-containing protein [Ignicoccus islandicus]